MESLRGGSYQQLAWPGVLEDRVPLGFYIQPRAERVLEIRILRIRQDPPDPFGSFSLYFLEEENVY